MLSFVPPFFVGLFSQAIGLPTSTGTAMVATFNFASAFGRLGFGYLCALLPSLAIPAEHHFCSQEPE